MARIETINGCAHSEPSVFPRNWKESGASTEIDWRIQYYFFDPQYAERWPNGKLCIVKGMNEVKGLAERRKITATLLDLAINDLREGWNPISKDYMLDQSIDYNSLNPDLPFIKAFRLANQKMACSENYRQEVGYVINRIEKAASKQKFTSSIENLKRRELKALLQECKFTAKYFNHAKAYLSSLFNELVEDECCDTNLTRDIRKKKVVKEVRRILSPDQLEAVMNYLKVNYYEFWRYAQIFMHSGGRSSELLTVQTKDVDLDNQEYTVLIKKGKQYKRVVKVILAEVLPLWREVMYKAKDNDYLFSEGLEPGQKSIRFDQISKRWRRLVKKSDSIVMNGRALKVSADFYTLKHSMLDSLPIEVAQKLASHTSSRTTAIYQVNKEKRDREELKRLRIA